ncbi:Mvb12 [Kluyveromyces lactis]|nr:Mvb12 [Kluyveromyces lactis]
MDTKLRKVVLYHGVESSEKWPKGRKKLTLPSLQLLPNTDTTELEQVMQFNSDIEELIRQRQVSRETFDKWYQETYLASKPKGLLEHLAPKRRDTGNLETPDKDNAN